MRDRPPAFWIDLAVKAALLGLLLLAVLRPDLPQFEGMIDTLGNALDLYGLDHVVGRR